MLYMIVVKNVNPELSSQGTILFFNFFNFISIWDDRCSLNLLWCVSQAALVKNLPSSAGDIRDSGLISGSERSLGRGHATHSSILSWRIPWTEQPGGLQSMGSQRVRHDWVTKHGACMWSVGSQGVGHNWSDSARITHKLIVINISWCM